MPESPESNYFFGEVERNINTLKAKVKKHKRKAYWINGLSIALGALITLILGLDVAEKYTVLQKNVALFAGAALTIVNGWNAFSNYRKLWTRQKSTLLDLYQLKNELGYRMASSEEHTFDDLFEKYQRVWEKDSNEWRDIVKPAQPQQDKKILK